MTGQSDYLLQIAATDLDAYALFINQVLRKMAAVNTMHSSLSLREIKSLSRLPLP
jgi:DNA-binding Lrp family transcriptional regulator